MRKFGNLLIFIAISISIIMMINLLSIGNLLLLVPWDVSFTRPEIGTWQRSLNDFFEGRTGEMTMFSLVTIATIVPVARTLRRRWSAGLRVVVANLIFFFVTYFIVTLAFFLSQAIFPFGEDFLDPFYVNYQRNVIPFVALWVMYGLWLKEIAGLAKARDQRKSKAKNSISDTENSTAIRRLTGTSGVVETNPYEESFASKGQVRSQ